MTDHDAAPSSVICGFIPLLEIKFRQGV